MLIICAFVCLITGCSSSNEKELETQVDKNKMFYETLKTAPKYSLLSVGEKSTRSLNDENGIPVLTPEDISFLASLSQEEFEEFLEELKYRIVAEGIASIDIYGETNFEELAELFQQDETVNVLINFAEEYLSENPGWESIERLLPDNLNDQEQQIFVLTATCIDNIERPILDSIVFDGRQLSFYKEDRSFCLQYLSHRLAIEGINVGAQLFVALFTGGTLEPVAAIGDVITLFSIWLDYKVCEHNWEPNK